MKSYLVTLNGVALDGSPFLMEAYQGGNALEAMIIAGILTGVLHSMKATGEVTVAPLVGPIVFHEVWITGVKQPNAYSD